MGMNREGFPKALKRFYDEMDNAKVGAVIAAQAASGSLTFAANAANNETVVIGVRTYTWKTALTGAKDEVLIGASAAASVTNLVAAINGAAGAGTTYGTGTAAHSEVTAIDDTGDVVTVTHKKTGSIGNSVATTETMANGSWAFTTLVNGYSISAKEHGVNSLRVTTLTLDQVHVPLTDGGATIGAGGGKKIYDFAETAFYLLSAYANLTVGKKATDAQISATFGGTCAIGTVVANAAEALAGTEADLLRAVARPAAVAGATSWKAIPNAVPAVPFDGSVTPVDMFLNAGVADVDSAFTGTVYLHFTGTIKFVWVDIGDI